MPLRFAAADTPSLPLYVVSADGLADWLSSQPKPVQAWLNAVGFKAGHGQAAVLPGENGSISGAVAGVGTAMDRGRGRFVLALVQSKLPDACFHIEGGFGGLDPQEQSLGWLLGQYRFDRYKDQRRSGASLIPPEAVDADKVEAIANGEALTRDLINTPASDMGPNDLERAARDLAEEFEASIKVCTGPDLLEQNFPMIHTVGRAAAQAPRLVDLRWGKAGPRLTLVGKGVCFDTGGLNIKPGASMGLMKKDMGGAATVLGLACMIMSLGVPIQLRVLIPAVENAIDGSAFRPGDILTSRAGLTVEINNTDAEGRLVLADALALADEEQPDLVISMATLTGAARVAVGPDLAPFYATDPALADALRMGATAAADPVWEMPFHPAYESMIEPGIADLDNAPKGGFAGSITAALFLKRFVRQTPHYMHFDIYGWQPSPAPGRPKGGVGQGARALLEALPRMLNL